MPIVKGHMRSGQVLGLERFNGEGYTMWRDKVLAQIETLGEKYQRGGLEKDQPGAIVVMMDFLDADSSAPPATTPQRRVLPSYKEETDETMEHYSSVLYSGKDDSENESCSDDYESDSFCSDDF
ncbi:hypothetical protein PI124_g14396 [Phytophthora idaei]|nr:hypothetical protein PI126_g11296 [Phytophthora idaei]KAG3240713.1 hypothetical protein PI124_g14396 [Phytophthora idaei]